MKVKQDESPDLSAIDLMKSDRVVEGQKAALSQKTKQSLKRMRTKTQMQTHTLTQIQTPKRTRTQEAVKETSMKLAKKAKSSHPPIKKTAKSSHPPAKITTTKSSYFPAKKTTKSSHNSAIRKVGTSYINDSRIIKKTTPAAEVVKVIEVVKVVEVVGADWDFLLDKVSFFDYPLDSTYVFWTGNIHCN